ncbi:ATP-binding protein [Zobellella sp. An-6]|uniref:ATP-binding protein n=1 Tax=Zobellella sp. An-6 TaxID=3400218 RepID=UPI0040410DDE
MVEDSEMGIDPADLPHIFERLYRADRGRHNHGLGLALVKAILDGHQARIEVESGTEGRRFRCLFPLNNSS